MAISTFISLIKWFQVTSSFGENPNDHLSICNPLAVAGLVSWLWWHATWLPRSWAQASRSLLQSSVIHAHTSSYLFFAKKENQLYMKNRAFVDILMTFGLFHVIVVMLIRGGVPGDPKSLTASTVEPFCAHPRQPSNPGSWPAKFSLKTSWASHYIW